MFAGQIEKQESAYVRGAEEMLLNKSPARLAERQNTANYSLALVILKLLTVVFDLRIQIFQYFFKFNFISITGSS